MRLNAVKRIKENISAFDVAVKYGFKPNRAGFICCPFHNEKTPSMKIYKGDGGYYCFGCGNSGDSIKFVQMLFGLSFQDALRKIDADFCLHIYEEHSFEQSLRFHYEQKAFEARQKREKMEKQKAEGEYWAIFDEWKRLDDNRITFAPQSASECFHPLFVESLLKLDHQRYILDCLEARDNT